MSFRLHLASIETDGWRLDSAEERNLRSPDGFQIPSRPRRESLVPGDAAQLLFDIETRSGAHVIDRGVDRMWVIVNAKAGSLYVGVLDSDPGSAEGLTLRRGTHVLFAPEHVVAIDRPPDHYINERLGPDWMNGSF